MRSRRKLQDTVMYMAGENKLARMIDEWFKERKALRRPGVIVVRAKSFLHMDEALIWRRRL